MNNTIFEDPRIRWVIFKWQHFNFSRSGDKFRQVYKISIYLFWKLKTIKQGCRSKFVSCPLSCVVSITALSSRDVRIVMILKLRPAFSINELHVEVFVKSKFKKPFPFLQLFSLRGCRKPFNKFLRRILWILFRLPWLTTRLYQPPSPPVVGKAGL